MIEIEEMNLMDGIKLLRINPDTFYMGRLPDDGEYSILNDPIEVSIEKSFWISDTPITNKQYINYLSDINKPIPNYLIEHWEFGWVKKYGFDKYLLENPDAPVVGVNYIDALEYIFWLKDKINLNIRFPTEAEYEYSTKANCSCKHYCLNAARIKNTLRDYGDPPRTKVPSVKCHKPNNFKLYDMQGLIWQWCSDWFMEFENNSNKINIKPDFALWKGQNIAPGRVIKGGSFNYSVLHSRCSSRHYSKEEDRNFNLGFRIASDL